MNLAECTIVAFKVNARGGADEERSIGAVKQALNDMPRQSVSRAKFPENAAVVAKKAILCAYPQVACMVLRHAIDIQVSQPRGRGAEAVLLSIARRRGKTERCQCA